MNMSGNIKEQLSALLDGELPVEEEELLLRRLSRDPEHCRTLARYSLIGECLRGAPAIPALLGVGDRVRAAVDKEDSHSVSPEPSGGRYWGLMGAGIAAAIAVVALVSLNGPEKSTGPAADSGLQRAVIAPARLTGYLVSHGEYTNGLSRQVINSYVVTRVADNAAWEVTEVSVNE